MGFDFERQPLRKAQNMYEDPPQSGWMKAREKLQLN
jgi:hypothetical protein